MSISYGDFYFTRTPDDISVKPGNIILDKDNDVLIIDDDVNHRHYIGGGGSGGNGIFDSDPIAIGTNNTLSEDIHSTCILGFWNNASNTTITGVPQEDMAFIIGHNNTYRSDNMYRGNTFIFGNNSNVINSSHITALGDSANVSNSNSIMTFGYNLAYSEITNSSNVVLFNGAVNHIKDCSDAFISIRYGVGSNIHATNAIIFAGSMSNSFRDKNYTNSILLSPSNAGDISNINNCFIMGGSSIITNGVNSQVIGDYIFNDGITNCTLLGQNIYTNGVYKNESTFIGRNFICNGTSTNSSYVFLTNGLITGMGMTNSILFGTNINSQGEYLSTTIGQNINAVGVFNTSILMGSNFGTNSLFASTLIGTNINIGQFINTASAIGENITAQTGYMPIILGANIGTTNWDCTKSVVIGLEHHPAETIIDNGVNVPYTQPQVLIGGPTRQNTTDRVALAESRLPESGTSTVLPHEILRYTKEEEMILDSNRDITFNYNGNSTNISTLAAGVAQIGDINTILASIVGA